MNAALLPVQRYDYTGSSGARRADIGPSPSFILPTSDGYVGANVLTQAQWEMLCQSFGKPEFIEDPLFADGWSRMENSRDLATQLAEQDPPSDGGGRIPRRADLAHSVWSDSDDVRGSQPAASSRTRLFP